MADLLDLLKGLFGITSDPPGVPIVGRYWEFPSEYWTDRTWGPDEYLFPEWNRIPAAKRDFGLCFSGGGSRSASATIGQLRGLWQLKWLQKAGYISCVSGGSWGSVPYVYSQYDDETFLGKLIKPGDLRWDDLCKTTPRSFNDTISKAALDRDQIVLVILQQLLAKNARTQKGLTTVLGKWVSEASLRGFFDQVDLASTAKQEKTYAGLLGQAFLEEHVPGADSQFFTWTAADANDLIQANGGGSFPNGFAVAHLGRPFVIANGAVLHKMPGFTQSPVPVEYTPLYSGVRQHISPVLGGCYVWSAAYGTHHPSLYLGDQSVRGYVRGITRSASRPFSLGDVIASSGAAPEFLLSNKTGQAIVDNGLAEAASYFPHFPIWSIHDASLGPTLRSIAHADGGAIDNLGLLALLARQVKNVIVFVNANHHYVQSDDLRAICGLGTVNAFKENHGLCQVFAPSHWDDIQRGFAECEARDEPIVFADSGWEVLPNQLFNVQGYKGLNICFVYNYPVKSFRDALPPDVRKRVPVYPNQTEKGVTDDQLVRYPWYETLAEQQDLKNKRIRLIALAPQTTQLLSHLAAWSITHDATVEKIRKHFGAVVA